MAASWPKVICLPLFLSPVALLITAPFSAIQSDALIAQVFAAALMSMIRVAAPASRMICQLLATLVLPPVICRP